MELEFTKNTPTKMQALFCAIGFADGAPTRRRKRDFFQLFDDRQGRGLESWLLVLGSHLNT